METRFFEEEETKLFFFKSYRYVCDVTVSDSAALGMIFSTATSKLKEWYDTRKSKAKEFELRLSAPGNVLKKGQLVMQELSKSGGEYQFVKKLTLVITFHCFSCNGDWCQL